MKQEQALPLLQVFFWVSVVLTRGAIIGATLTKSKIKDLPLIIVRFLFFPIFVWIFLWHHLDFFYKKYINSFREIIFSLQYKMVNKREKNLTLLKEQSFDQQGQNLLLKLFFRYIIGENPSIFRRIAVYKDENEEIQLHFDLKREVHIRKINFRIELLSKQGIYQNFDSTQVSWKPVRAVSTQSGIFSLVLKIPEIREISIAENNFKNIHSFFF